MPDDPPPKWACSKKLSAVLCPEAKQEQEAKTLIPDWSFNQPDDVTTDSRGDPKFFFYRQCFFVFLHLPGAREAYERSFGWATAVFPKPDPIQWSTMLYSLCVCQDLPALRLQQIEQFFLTKIAGQQYLNLRFPGLTEDEILRLFIERFTPLAIKCSRISGGTFQEVRTALCAHFTQGGGDDLVIVSGEAPFGDATATIPISLVPGIEPLLAVAVWCIAMDGAATNVGPEAEFFGAARDFLECLRQSKYICYMYPSMPPVVPVE
jgi:hypothetical protein